MKVNRQGLIVWFQHMKNVRQIKRHGHLIYTSKKLKYAVLYVNQADVEDIESKLLKYPFISRVDRSFKPFIRNDFEKATPEKTKQLDYKMGI